MCKHIEQIPKGIINPKICAFACDGMFEGKPCEHSRANEARDSVYYDGDVQFKPLPETPQSIARAKELAEIKHLLNRNKTSMPN